MDFDKNRREDAAERRTGADNVLARIRETTLTDLAKLEWIGDLGDPTLGSYRLRVSVGTDQEDFKFTDEGLINYHPDRPRPRHVDDTIDTIIDWILDRTT